MGGDAGITGKDQARPGVNYLLENGQADAVRFGAAHRDVVADPGAQVAQGGDQHAGGGLAVDVEIAPDTDLFAAADGGFQPVRSRAQAGQFRRRTGGVAVRIEERPGSFRGAHPPAPEDLGEQW